MHALSLSSCIGHSRPNPRHVARPATNTTPSSRSRRVRHRTTTQRYTHCTDRTALHREMMMMMKPATTAASAVGCAAACCIVVLLSATSASAAAAGCDARQLTPCAGPAVFGGAVPPACCAQLRAQQGCLCGYERSPNYGAYIRSPNAKRLFSVCGLPVPRCG
ncbi:unnamed protein product [Urochloa humidicola]